MSNSNYSIAKRPNGTFLVTGTAQDGTPVNVVVIPGTVFSDEARTTGNFCALAAGLGLDKSWGRPQARSFLSEITPDDFHALGLEKVVTLLSSSDGSQRLETIKGLDGGWPYPDSGRPDSKWHRRHGFAFVVPQAPSSQR